MSFSFSAPRIQYEDIADEVAKMSLEEQDAARGDLFGERPLVRESEEMIQHSLEELEECIEKSLLVYHSIKEAYETAQVICPEYVNSRDFRLIFLRCERFDCTKAAERIVNYWDRKVEIWGEDKAFRRLKLDDFDDEDEAALTRGGFKILPERDDAGRGILLSHRLLFDRRTSHHNSMLRLCWYVAEAAIEDVDVQRNGIVIILYSGLSSFDHTSKGAKLDRKLMSILRCALPVRVVATHHIISNPVLKLLAENGLFWVGEEHRARYKQHSGVRDEYLESLAIYGIQPRILPEVMGGVLDFNYEEWLRNRRAQGS